MKGTNRAAAKLCSIPTKADITVGSFYQYFKDKKAFENTWYTVPPLVIQKFYFGEYYSFLNDKFYRDKFYKSYENGKLKEVIDIEFALYL